MNANIPKRNLETKKAKEDGNVLNNNLIQAVLYNVCRSDQALTFSSTKNRSPNVMPYDTRMCADNRVYGLNCRTLS